MHSLPSRPSSTTRVYLSLFRHRLSSARYVCCLSEKISSVKQPYFRLKKCFPALNFPPHAVTRSVYRRFIDSVKRPIRSSPQSRNGYSLIPHCRADFLPQNRWTRLSDTQVRGSPMRMPRHELTMSASSPGLLQYCSAWGPMDLWMTS